MDTYKLEFGEWVNKTNSFEIADLAIFYVLAGGVSFPLRIQMSATLYSMLQGSNGYISSHEELRNQMLRIALPRFIGELNSLETPKAATNEFVLKVDFSSEDKELFRSDATSVKRCQHQEMGFGGLMCRVSGDTDEMSGKTSKALCASCDFPEDILRCDNLSHPEVKAICTDAGCLGRRVTSGFCDIKLKSFDCNKCVPGVFTCWRREINNLPTTPEIPRDIAERVIDELQYLNLQFRHAFGNSLLKINDLRTVTQVLTPCDTQEEFTTKVACIGDLFNNLELGEYLKKDETKNIGKLTQLENFLRQRSVLVDDGPIRILKKVISLRNSFPIHSGKTSFIAACGDLGLQYPPENWEKAWHVILYHTYKSLRALRVMLPG